ncbi:hypothetical protein Tsubulata_009692 [Turnera subulata]|uniref:ABC transporter domain-containing protein n=1 Tax=Turnera subulata TaxID=218843 RepID=A0A9Q0JCG8_9ROSI|nr:hypothetical protein Tsubulata_009692 [Turnera subulata]
MWNSAENAFARTPSFREQGEDEEALQWAALERLPTYARVRRGIFRNLVGDQREIDLSELKAQEHKVLLDRLVSSVDDDPERFFNRMRERLQAVRLEFPKVEVRVQNLTVESFVHVGSRALPTIPNFIFNMTEALLRQLRIHGGNRSKLTILDNISGIIRPSRLTLLLGPPSSGKTTLLLALAGRLGHNLQVSGKITYNGHGLNEFVAPRTSAYVSQQDWHIAEMTVRETLEFSGRCQGVGSKYDMLVELARREKIAGIKPDEDLDIFMKSLALGGQETSLVVEYIMKLYCLAREAADGLTFLIHFLGAICMVVVRDMHKVSMLVAKLPVLYKHRDLHFYPSWAYTLPSWILSIPTSLIESGLWVAVTYYVIGYDPNITRFFRQFLVYFFLHQMSISLFRVIGSLGRNMIVANTFGSFAMLVVMALGGYIISRALGRQQAVVSKEELQERDKRRKGENVVIELREYLQHSGSVNGKYFKQRGMVLPFQPLSMSFSDINYFVDVPVAFVEEVMELVELTPLRGALVGLPGVDGLSTEQRKRLTIAVELVANPSIVFMDEPTSGLDARAAAIVMRTVRNIVNTGRTIVCTIHQPSIDIFESFDELLFMKRGGEVIYAGPLGAKSCELIKYFEAVQGVPKIRPGYNPAAWMLEVTSSAQENRLGVDFAEIYRKSNLFQRNKELVDSLSKPNSNAKELSFATKYSQSFFEQFLACLWKQNLSYWRNPQYTAVRFFYTVVISLMLGTICWRFGSKRGNAQELFNAMGSLYAAVLFIGVTNGSSVQPVVSVERFVSYRERAAGMYSALPFAFAQVVIEFPYVLAQTLIYCSIFYSMASFQWTVLKFVWYAFFMYFTMLYFTFYGMMMTAVTPNHNVASIVAAPFYMLWNLFSGFMIPYKRIPIWWRWYYWANPIAWTLYGLLTSQYGDDDRPMKLSDGDRSLPLKQVLKEVFGYHHDFLGIAGIMVVGFCVLFAVIFAFAIKAFNFQRR